MKEAIEGLWTRGFGRLGKLVSEAQAEEIRGWYEDAERFRTKRIDMARYRFGRGEYQYL